MLKFRNICAGILALSCTSMYTAQAAIMSAFLQNKYEIGEGTTYTQIIGSNQSGYQNANIVEYKPNASITPIIAYGDKVYGKSNINTIKNYLTNKGYNVISGINADFFVLSTGVPIGIVIENGVLKSSDASQNAIGFKADGSVIMDKPMLNMTITASSGTTNIQYFNKTRSTAGIYMLDSNFSSESRINTKGRGILFENINSDPIKVGSSVQLKVIGEVDSSSSSTIEPNQMLLTIDEKGPIDRLPKLNTGEIVTFNVYAKNEAWNSVLHSVGGYQTLVENSNINPALEKETKLEPRSAIGVKADGTVVIYEVDGRLPNKSLGISLKDLASEMIARGCVTAINLDGGGSSVMSLKYPGESETNIISSPSAGSPRSSANYIFLVSNASATGTPQNIHMYPKTPFVLNGGTVPIDTKATDSNFHPVATPSNVIYEVTSNNASIENGILTAHNVSANINIVAKYNGQKSSLNVASIDKLDSFSVVKKGEESNVKEISLIANQTVDLDAFNGKLRNLNVSHQDSQFTWEADKNIGTISSEGIFTASDTMGTGKITVSYGNTKNSVTVNVGLAPAETSIPISNFEHSVFFKSDSEIGLKLDNNPENISSGKSSLKVSLPESKKETSLIYNDGVILNPDYKYMSVWAKDITDNVSIYASFEDADFNTTQSEFIKQDESGNFVAKIPDIATKFTGIIIDYATSGKQDIYLDNLLTSKSEMLDMTTPEINFINPVSSTDSTGLNIKARITDNNRHVNDENIQVFVNGIKTTFKYTPFNGELSVNVSGLLPGINRITITVTDSYGNISTNSIDISTPDTSTNPIFEDTADNWANQIINFVDNKGIMSGSIKDGKKYFNPNSNLTKAELSVIISRYLELDTSDEELSIFEDMQDIPQWAKPHAVALYNEGIIKGSSKDGKIYFEPNKNVTRAEVITIIDRILPRGYSGDGVSFTDSEAIPQWAYKSISYIVNVGLLKGFPDGSIRPSNNISRAEAAKLLYSLY